MYILIKKKLIGGPLPLVQVSLCPWAYPKFLTRRPTLASLSIIFQCIDMIYIIELTFTSLDLYKFCWGGGD